MVNFCRTHKGKKKRKKRKNRKKKKKTDSEIMNLKKKTTVF